MATAQRLTSKSDIMARYFKKLAICYWLLAVGIIAFCPLLFTSCQEGGDAGDLWGQWRMADSDKLYIGFSGNIARLQDTSQSSIFVYGNFQHVGDSLFIQCFSQNGSIKDTAMVEEVFGFKPFNNVRLKVVSVSSDRLVLSKDSQTWNFSSY